MQHALRLLSTIVALTLPMTPVVGNAQDTTVFSVAYIEVKPPSTEQAIGLLRAYAAESQGESGNQRFQVLQRTGRPNHFAILDAWDDQQALDDHAAATHTTAFRKSLEPLLYSPYDERRSTPTMGTAGAGREGEVYVLTHIDLAGQGREDGMALVERLVTASRRDPGAVDVGVVIQDSRTNHMTLFEVWSSVANQEAHSMAEHTIQVRNGLLSRIGSPYDERLYHRL